MRLWQLCGVLQGTTWCVRGAVIRHYLRWKETGLTAGTTLKPEVRGASERGEG